MVFENSEFCFFMYFVLIYTQADILQCCTKGFKCMPKIKVVNYAIIKIKVKINARNHKLPLMVV